MIRIIDSGEPQKDADVCEGKGPFNMWTCPRPQGSSPSLEALEGLTEEDIAEVELTEEDWQEIENTATVFERQPAVDSDVLYW